MADYKMDNEIICNGGCHIPSAINVTRVIMDVDYINIEVAA